MQPHIDWENLDAESFYCFLRTDKQAFELADHYGLLYQTMLCDCGSHLVRRQYGKARYGVQFECSSRPICRKTKSILAGSWFSNANIGIMKGFFMLQSYAMEVDCRGMHYLSGVKSKSTITNWRQDFRTLCESVIDGEDQDKIGGAGCIVEIDETMVFHRKANTGRLTADEERQQWLLGGICRETGQGFIARVGRRDASTMLPIIVEKVAKGTRIITDKWRAYSGLEALGFSHSAINHSLNFVDPDDPSVNTQRIERMWRTLKNIIPKGCVVETRWSYLAEFLFKHRHGWYDITIGARIKLLVDSLKEIDFD